MPAPKEPFEDLHRKQVLLDILHRPLPETPLDRLGRIPRHLAYRIRGMVEALRSPELPTEPERRQIALDKQRAEQRRELAKRARAAVEARVMDGIQAEVMHYFLSQNDLRTAGRFLEEVILTDPVFHTGGMPQRPGQVRYHYPKSPE